MGVILQARFDEARLKKISQIQQATGLTTSQLFRRLVDAAEVKPLDLTVNLSVNASNDVTTRQGSHVVASA